MEPSEELKKEIYNQWCECENNEIMSHRGQFGENPDSFKIFTWSYIRATQNAIKLLKSLLSENRLLYLEDSVSEFEYTMQCELNEKLSNIGIEDGPSEK